MLGIEIDEIIVEPLSLVEPPQIYELDCRPFIALGRIHKGLLPSLAFVHLEPSLFYSSSLQWGLRLFFWGDTIPFPF